jgi:hypothetical protein
MVTSRFRQMVYYIVVLGLLGMGCREEDAKVVNKLDPRLKMQVEQLEGTMLSVFIHTAKELDEAQRRTLESHGVVIQSQAGTVYVCQMPLKGVLPVAREKFVVRLEAPKELKPQ